jgi:hypothetical protein
VAGGGLAAEPNFFLAQFSERNDVWCRLCTHREAAKVMTFASVT